MACFLLAVPSRTKFGQKCGHAELGPPLLFVQNQSGKYKFFYYRSPKRTVPQCPTAHTGTLGSFFYSLLTERLNRIIRLGYRHWHRLFACPTSAKFIQIVSICYRYIISIRHGDSPARRSTRVSIFFSILLLNRWVGREERPKLNIWFSPLLSQCIFFRPTRLLLTR